MGAFYDSVQIRSDDREAVRTALEELARKKARHFLLGPALNGWIGVYPNQDFATARDLARRLRVELVALNVHDDDIFTYEYYRDGKRVDQYNSAPDYFKKISTIKRRKLRGQPELLAHLASEPAKFWALRDRLAAQDNDPVTFASELLENFADMLGIRNALTSYAYLKEQEETVDIEGWDQFLHIPDLSSEHERERQHDAALQEQKQRLIQEGRLLAECGGLRGMMSLAPKFCPSPDGRGFLVAWSSHAADPAASPLPLERYGPPWSAGPAPTPWKIPPRVFGLDLSPSGRYLAVAHAAGDWHATLWDLSENRLVADVPQVRAVTGIGFVADESAMFSASADGDEGRVILTPTDGTQGRVFPLEHADRAAAHPSGAWLVVTDNYRRLFVVDLASGEIRLAGLVGGRSPFGHLQQQVTARLRATLDKADFDALTERMRQQPECGAESVFSLGFDSTGEYLCLATSKGVRVLAWNEVRDADGMLPIPVLAVDAAGHTLVREDTTPQGGSYIYGLEYDRERNRFLFAGLDGRVGYLDSGSGSSGIILEPPALPPIHQLALSRDGTTLALACAPEMYSHSRNKQGPVLQFWSYLTISSAPGPGLRLYSEE